MSRSGSGYQTPVSTASYLPAKPDKIPATEVFERSAHKHMVKAVKDRDLEALRKVLTWGQTGDGRRKASDRDCWWQVRIQQTIESIHCDFISDALKQQDMLAVDEARRDAAEDGVTYSTRKGKKTDTMVKIKKGLDATLKVGIRGDAKVLRALLTEGARYDLRGPTIDQARAVAKLQNAIATENDKTGVLAVKEGRDAGVWTDFLSMAEAEINLIVIMRAKDRIIESDGMMSFVEEYDTAPLSVQRDPDVQWLKSLYDHFQHDARFVAQALAEARRAERLLEAAEKTDCEEIWHAPRLQEAIAACNSYRGCLKTTGSSHWVEWRRPPASCYICGRAVDRQEKGLSSAGAELRDFRSATEHTADLKICWVCMVRNINCQELIMRKRRVSDNYFDPTEDPGYGDFERSPVRPGFARGPTHADVIAAGGAAGAVGATTSLYAQRMNSEKVSSPTNRLASGLSSPTVRRSTIGGGSPRSPSFGGKGMILGKRPSQIVGTYAGTTPTPGSPTPTPSSPYAFKPDARLAKATPEKSGQAADDAAVRRLSQLNLATHTARLDVQLKRKSTVN